MEYVLFFIGLLLLILALNVGGFFKIILWAASVGLMLYSLPSTEVMEYIEADERFAASMALIGLIQILASITEYKIFGIVVFREVSDFVIHGLGIVMVIVGLCMVL